MNILNYSCILWVVFDLLESCSLHCVLLLCRLMMVLFYQTKPLCILLQLKMENIKKTKLNVSSIVLLSTSVLLALKVSVSGCSAGFDYL
jgi:hypothetical protein